MLNKIKKAVMVGICGVFFSINAQAEEIKVLAAASLKYVLEEIKGDFLADKKGDSIAISYISSGKAYAQIKNGSPTHLFVAADVSYPAKLYAEKLAPSKEEIYAKGKLVFWSNDTNFKVKEFGDILNPKITHIAIPNPKVAPYGRASMEALEATKMLEKVQNKFVTGESIGAATTYVESKNAEVGFTALSMLGESGINTPTMSFVAIDEKLYKPIEQALVITNYGKDSKLAKDFKEYILSKSAKEKFVKFGYSVE
ncbi:molybdate ABC transporter substrate-binding protein [Helicobacter turcicus]|uniref:Molybdate ABC transporter substrate-binding protein n=1 Tax=Helicobacter turcicus TaxID=2867412 RepID=A0ABS7JM63_9HELI|nr:molybdate ABC transporter substrate-binding protein [Helicobacter turcicus]MBX7490483.1 molybdate ABC transporter substrate-binding protein [Helicobacter turcicus]MBX7545343.1 molybdate ABC transporter substrate-binding protein [Helicobacter turcicus]